MLATTIVFISTQLQFFFFRFINICSVFGKFEEKKITRKKGKLYLL